MAREGSKRQVAIEIMNANAKKPMAEVLALIAKANGIEVGAARSYYVYLVKQGMAKGTIEAAPKAPKTVSIQSVMKKAGKAYAEKKAAASKTKAEAVKKLEASKSPQEIEKIKKANMERMKAVLAKTKQNVAKTEEAPAFAETDSYAAPTFLTKDEVIALV